VLAEQGADLRAGQVPTGQRGVEDPTAGREHVVGQALLGSGAGDLGPDPAPGEPQQPAQVLRRDVVPGGPQHVRAQQLARRARPLHLQLGQAVGGQAPADHLPPVHG